MTLGVRLDCLCYETRLAETQWPRCLPLLGLRLCSYHSYLSLWLPDAVGLNLQDVDNVIILHTCS